MRRFLYISIHEELVDYALEMGYTHLEILPLSNIPRCFLGLSGNRYFSVTSRFGAPHDFMYFVIAAIRKVWGNFRLGAGHFCKDAHGLRQFDGAYLYEYEDSRKSESAE